jgi:hypothetical protein
MKTTSSVRFQPGMLAGQIMLCDWTLRNENLISNVFSQNFSGSGLYSCFAKICKNSSALVRFMDFSINPTSCLPQALSWVYFSPFSTYAGIIARRRKTGLNPCRTNVIAVNSL